jgi:hypothetical protein
MSSPTVNVMGHRRLMPGNGGAPASRRASRHHHSRVDPSAARDEALAPAVDEARKRVKTSSHTGSATPTDDKEGMPGPIGPNAFRQPLAAPRRFRSRMQLPGIAGSCLLAVAVGVANAITLPAPRGLIEVAAYLAIAATVVAGPGLSAIYVTEEGVRVRNPLSSTTIPWAQIRGFRIGRHKLLGEVCLIDLADGSSQYAFAIQIPNATRGRHEIHMVDELNRILTAHPHV